MEHEVTANTPFIENPQMEEWKSAETLETSSHSVILQTDPIPTYEIFRSTVHEVEHWYTSEDLEALEPEFLEESGDQPMLSVKDDTGERLPLYCQYVNGRLQTVYHARAEPYSFEEIDTQPDTWRPYEQKDLTSSSDL